MGVFERLRRNVWVLAAFAWMASVLLAMSAGDRRGEERERAKGQSALDKLALEYTTQRAQVAEDNLVLYRQQVTRANQSEELLLDTQHRLAGLQQQLQERIPNVSTVYRPAPAAEPVAIPRCVFTAGWVRDFNLALGGASLPGAGAGTTSSGTEAAAWPAPGSAEELLESGISPADILAFAQDYGRWSLGNLAQLNALLNLHKD